MTSRNREVEKQVQLWFGPQYPGITGNMSVQAWLKGDTLTSGITHVGYLHRGFEKLVERRTFIQAFPIVCRICVAEPDNNEYLLAAAAVEELAGWEIPEKAKWIRTLVMEMSRIQGLLAATGGAIGSMGMGAVPNWMISLRDHVLDRFEELTGARVYHMYIIYGGVRRDLPEGFAERMEETLALIESKLDLIDATIFDSAVFRKRAKGIGVVPEEWVDVMGITGPPVRAMGIARDTRKDYPYLAYPDLDFDVVTTTGSDIYARTWVRRHEIQQSIDLIRQILEKMPKDGPYCLRLPNMLNWKVPAGQTYVRSEASRGEMSYFLVTDGSDKIRRMHVRGTSFVHGVTLLERMIPGTNISDLSPLMVSLQTCPPEIER